MMRVIALLVLVAVAQGALVKKAAPLAAKKVAGHVVLTVDQKKTMHSGCVSACKPSPVESKCVTACETAMYKCIDETGPNETPEDTKKCQDAVLKKYQETKGVEKKEEKKEEKKGAKKEGKKEAKKKMFLQLSDDEDGEDTSLNEEFDMSEGEEQDGAEMDTDTEDVSEEDEEASSSDDAEENTEDSEDSEDGSEEDSSSDEAEEVTDESIDEEQETADVADEDSEGSDESEDDESLLQTSSSDDGDADADEETTDSEDSEGSSDVDSAGLTEGEEAEESDEDSESDEGSESDASGDESDDESFAQTGSSWKPEHGSGVHLYEHPQGSTVVMPCPVTSFGNPEACNAYFGNKADGEQCPQITCPKALGVTMKLTCSGGCCPTCWAPDHVIAVDRHTSVDDAAVVDSAPQAPGSCGGVKCFKLACAPGFSEGHVNGACCYSCVQGR